MFPDSTGEGEAAQLDRVREALREGQLLVLELVAAGDTLEAVLSTLCLLVERSAEDVRAAVLISREDGHGVLVGAAPSFTEALGDDGEALLQHFAREALTATLGLTIEDTVSWANERTRASTLRRLGIGSLRCVPVRGPDSGHLGLFVLTSALPGPLPEVALGLVHEYTALASVAIRNDQRERSLARSHAAIREAQRIGRFGDLTLACGSPHMSWSAQTYALYQRRPSDPVPLVPEFIALHGPLNREALEQALAGQGPAHVDLELELDLPNGQHAHHRFLLSRVVAQGEPARLTGTVQDITERKRTENALQQAQRLESLGLLAGGIAHDFNNLLAALLANVNLLQRRVPEDSNARPSLSAIEGIVHRATDLTRQILTYAGRSKVREELVDIDALVTDMTSLLAAAIPKTVHVERELHATDLAIKGDPAQLQQVIMNLVTNAVDAIGEQEGKVSVRTSAVTFTEEELNARFPGQAVVEGRFAVLEVRDTGVGMAPATVARMFDPFFTTKRSGRGLGLSAVRGILRTHGAGFQIESTLGQGTLMRVAFPVEGRGQGARVTRPSDLAPKGSGRLLVVDDEDEVRVASAHALSECGYEVVVASDGAAALREFEREPAAYRAVLSDLRMPKMDGRELFDHVRRLRPDIPFVLCTGYGDASDLRELVQSERAVLLEKPLRIDDLVVTIERLALTSGMVPID